MKQQKPRDIQIGVCLNGFIARCGCQTLVFTTLSAMLRELDLYLQNPLKVEKEYVNAAYYNMMDGPIDPGSGQLCRAPESIREANQAVVMGCVATPAETQCEPPVEAPRGLERERVNRDPILR